MKLKKILNNIVIFGLISFSPSFSTSSGFQKMQGSWVKADYVKHILKTKSPRKSADYLEDIASFTIARVDTLPVIAGVNWNNHEGDQFTINDKIGKYGYQTDYHIDNNIVEIKYDSSHVRIFLIDSLSMEKKKVVDYVKVNDFFDGDGLLDGIQSIINGQLIMGKYLNMTSKDSNFIEFNGDGSLKGLGAYDRYFIQTDFMVLPDLVDNIILYKGEKVYENYCIDFNKSLIEIKEAKKGANESIVACGKKMWVLQKIK